MRHLERRLRVLEQRAPAARADGMTVAEWVQWHTTGQQPERWLKSDAIQAQVAEIMSRVQASLAAVQVYEDALIDSYEDQLREFGGYE